MKLQPLGGNIVVQAVDEESVTASGVIIPSTASKEKPQKGKVVALGTGRILDNGTKVDFAVKVGDEVLFKKYAPDEVKLDSEEYLIMSEADVLAIIK
jgi:chaperonin GroES